MEKLIKSFGPAVGASLFFGVLFALFALSDTATRTWETPSPFDVILGVFGAVVLGVIWSIVPAFIYFCPAMIAGFKDSPNYTGIFLVNLLAGWTLVGWFACLIWACTGGQKVVVQHIYHQGPPPLR